MNADAVKSALDELTEDATPRDTLTLFGATKLPDKHTRAMPAGLLDGMSRALCIVIDAAERKGIRPHRIRAACHLIWGQPCYAGRGTLTLCDPEPAHGALTMSAVGALEVV